MIAVDVVVKEVSISNITDWMDRINDLCSVTIEFNTFKKTNRVQ